MRAARFEGHTSNFVSTTSSLSAAIEHAASLARPNSEEPFDTDFVTYIYQVRPDHDFYDVEASLAHARDAASPGSMRRARLESIIRDYAGMDELVAHRGFSHERIIAYAELTGTLLQRFGVAAGSPLFSPTFWSHRWIANANYRPAYDADTSNLDVYLNVGDPRGYRDMVANQTQVAVPTDNAILMVETKKRKDLPTTEVQSKAESAVRWCKLATEHAATVGGKQWKYLLIPHDEIAESNRLSDYLRFEMRS